MLLHYFRFGNLRCRLCCLALKLARLNYRKKFGLYAHILWVCLGLTFITTSITFCMGYREHQNPGYGTYFLILIFRATSSRKLGVVSSQAPRDLGPQTIVKNVTRPYYRLNLNPYVSLNLSLILILALIRETSKKRQNN